MGLEGNKGDRTYFFFNINYFCVAVFPTRRCYFCNFKIQEFFFFIKLLNFILGYSRLDVVIVSGRQ